MLTTITRVQLLLLCTVPSVGLCRAPLRYGATIPGWLSHLRHCCTRTCCWLCAWQHSRLWSMAGSSWSGSTSSISRSLCGKRTLRTSSNRSYSPPRRRLHCKLVACNGGGPRTRRLRRTRLSSSPGSACITSLTWGSVYRQNSGCHAVLDVPADHPLLAISDRRFIVFMHATYAYSSCRPLMHAALICSHIHPGMATCMHAPPASLRSPT
jgi:hypothetical protein